MHSVDDVAKFLRNLAVTIREARGRADLFFTHDMLFGCDELFELAAIEVDSLKADLDDCHEALVVLGGRINSLKDEIAFLKSEAAAADDIIILCGDDEVARIDGELASFVKERAVSEYLLNVFKEEARRGKYLS